MERVESPGTPPELRAGVTFNQRRKPRWSGAVAGGLFCRCGLFDRGSLGFGLFTLFIRAVQKTLDQAGTALLRDLRPLGLILVLEDFVISRVAHGIPPSAEHTNSRATQQYGLCSNLTIAVPILYARMSAFGLP